MSKLDLPFSIPDIGSKFEYIDDVDLRTQLEYSFNYILFLINLSESYSLPWDISYSLNKDIIVNIASMIESILFYVLINISKYWNEVEIKILTKKAIRKDVYSEEKKIHDLSEDCHIFWGKKKVVFSWVTEKIQFNDLIECWRQIWMYDKDFSSKLHEIREKRNQIHLHTVPPTVAYSKKDLGKIFDITKQFMEKIKKRIKT